MIPVAAKVVVSASLSVLAIVLYLAFRGQERKRCMVAMLLCTLADVFMVDSFGLGDVSLYPGAALFIGAHVLYGLCFARASARKGYRFANAGLVAGLALVVLTGAILAVLALTVPQEPQVVMLVLVLVYLAVLGFNLVCQFSYAVSERGARYLLMVGMLLFLISDVAIFIHLVNLGPEFDNFVWATYVPAQLLVVLFNSPLRLEVARG